MMPMMMLRIASIFSYSLLKFRTLPISAVGEGKGGKGKNSFFLPKFWKGKFSHKAIKNYINNVQSSILGMLIIRIEPPIFASFYYLDCQ